MVERSIGKAKMTSEVRQRLADMAAEVRQLVYGEAGCPEWGTLFAEIEDDAVSYTHLTLPTICSV